ncbi:hypothetical protein pb186bvf_005049 [Paramecium bursaria]
MNQIQEETYSNGFEIKTTQSFLFNVWMFIQELIQGSLFILFSIYNYGFIFLQRKGSQDCLALRYFCLIYGIILIPDSILTLLWNIYVQKNQNDHNVHFLSLRAFSFVLNFMLCIQLFVILLSIKKNEDCGELKILAICFLITSLIYFIYFWFNACTFDTVQIQNNEISNVQNWG